jgi:dynein heavy chain
MSIKNAFVPPKGIQAGLSRTFNTEINPDFLERVEPIDKWKNIVFTVCFMHSIVLERRKFGPLGFTVPYEFNYGDMLASLTFIEKHMNSCFANQQKESWKAIRYITCDVQYGGRITDNMDREMFSTYGDLWLDDPIFKPGYNFNPNSEFAYKIPETTEHAKFLEHVSTLPSNDSPAIFGLNNLADLTYRLSESAALINTLVDVQPKDSGSGGGLSREDQVKKDIEEKILKELPANFDPIDTYAAIERFKIPKGLSATKNVPLSIFLK